MAEYPTLLQTSLVATALKVLLWPAYRSTDFEVHRNWLALTHSLPLREWYHEKTSQWTLDYPPYFAYFEYTLSQLGRFADENMLHVSNLGYDSWNTIFFQRATVIVTEAVLIYALYLFIQSSPAASKKQSHAAAASILLSPGLLIIDHLHFQYNGFLYGILILSIVLARKKSGLLASGFVFAALLCLKHIYLYLAPAYFVYLLRGYCLGPRSIFDIRFGNCVKLGLGIGAVFALAFGPFVYYGQMEQVFSRLFPFSRGLCHAYWAPNVWALYSFCDRVLIYGKIATMKVPLKDGADLRLTAAPYLKLAIDRDAVNSVTRGLVGDTSFAVLPNISPRMTFILTLAAQIVSHPLKNAPRQQKLKPNIQTHQPALIKLFFTPTWHNFVSTLTLCGYASFLFGWHVHEKAILLVIIPFSLLALTDRRYLGAFRPLAVSGHVSLFPLLFTAMEGPIKVAYTVTWLVIVLLAFDWLAPASPQPRVFLLDRFALLYIAVAIPLMVYCSLVHQLVFGARYEFLPLMFVSTYSAIGVVGSWLGFLVVFFTS
ncbi:glycosyl transferase [Meristemomyces frigidus]|uniref:Alpha-1,3-glucosyltransferase n=1 Tax=Meristemomyces frigidus TaxID=1508187 RepID=A0AAN7YD57_9PEZI|nr:glycosyl transferase [Meristemomyces frigidus]